MTDRKETTMLERWLLPLLLVLAAYPTWLALTAQPTAIVAPVAICAYWLLVRRKLFFFAGLISALTILRLEWLPFIAVPGLILGGLPFIGGFAAAAAGIFGAAQMLHQPLDFANLIANSQGVVSAVSMQNFSALLALILNGNTANLQIGTMAMYIIAVASSTELWWRLHHMPDSQNKFLKKCAASVLIMMTAGTRTMITDYVALVPIIVWLWQATADDTKDTGGLIRKVIVVYPFLTWAYFAAQTAFPALQIPIYFVWATVLAVTILPTLDVEVNNLLNRRFKPQA